MWFVLMVTIFGFFVLYSKLLLFISVHRLTRWRFWEPLVSCASMHLVFNSIRVSFHVHKSELGSLAI